MRQSFLDQLRKQIEEMQQEMFPAPPEFDRPGTPRPDPAPRPAPAPIPAADQDETVVSMEVIEPEIREERPRRRERPVEDVAPEIRERPERRARPAASAPVGAAGATRSGMTHRRQIQARLRSPAAIRQAILINEILGPPKALRDWSDPFGN